MAILAKAGRKNFILVLGVASVFLLSSASVSAIPVYPETNFVLAKVVDVTTYVNPETAQNISDFHLKTLLGRDYVGVIIPDAEKLEHISNLGNKAFVIGSVSSFGDEWRMGWFLYPLLIMTFTNIVVFALILVFLIFIAWKAKERLKGVVGK